MAVDHADHISASDLGIRHPVDRDAQPGQDPHLSDQETIALLGREPRVAWRAFLERYANYILAVLHSLGLDRDQAMDRFVYVCEKLSENDFRRLRSVRYVGPEGGLKPWLNQVTRRLATNWVWQRSGRRRLSRPIERRSMRDQTIFKSYFWDGLSAVEIHETLKATTYPSLQLADVLDSLEAIFQTLGPKRIWRLVAQKARRARPVSLDAAYQAIGYEPEDGNRDPERRLLAAEEATSLNAAFEGLSVRERLVARLRLEEALAVSEISTLVGIERRDVENTLKRALRKLRRALRSG